jgi:hypothetical protein
VSTGPRGKKSDFALTGRLARITVFQNYRRGRLALLQASGGAKRKGA